MLKNLQGPHISPYILFPPSNCCGCIETGTEDIHSLKQRLLLLLVMRLTSIFKNLFIYNIFLILDSPENSGHFSDLQKDLCLFMAAIIGFNYPPFWRISYIDI